MCKSLKIGFEKSFKKCIKKLVDFVALLIGRFKLFCTL